MARSVASISSRVLQKAVRRGTRASEECVLTIDSQSYLSILLSKSQIDMPSKTRRKKQVTPERLMQFGFAYAPPLIIGAAVSNKVFDALESRAKTVEQVEKETGTSERGLRAIMNALVGLDLLKKDRQGKYSLTPESAAFLLSDKAGTLAGFFHLILPQHISKWLRLTDIVRAGRPDRAVNEETEGTKFFTDLVENIIPMSYGGARALADHLKVAKAKHEIRVLDLAAGSGIWGIALAQKSPAVHVTAVDWSGMIPTTKRITQRFGVADRFNYVEGDLLEANFENGYDIATLGHILHSEGKERSLRLLEKTFRALKSGGTIAIAEWLVNDERTGPPPSLMFAVQMLVNTEKGDTFSFNEIRSWLQDTGFKNVRKLEAPGPSPLILATKA
jgi:ubiquinone/menaquinone biosynthesis C-methylase UbiE